MNDTPFAGGESDSLPRRKFLEGFFRLTVGALAAAVLYPVARFLSPPRVAEETSTRVLAGKVSELAKDKWKIFPFGSEPGLLVEKAPGEYVALSATCTHLQCTVQYEPAQKRVWCACHNGYYDLQGRNVSGPPPRPLTPYVVQVSGDDIFVSRA
ncbi:MAG TPA: Rieske (2Fe-2S) protein [Candidatus Eisenbacteria bacterium]